MRPPGLLGRMSIRCRLAAIAAVGVALVLVTATAGVVGLVLVGQEADELATLSRMLRLHQDGDMVHERLLADGYAAVLGGRGGAGIDLNTVRADLDAAVERLHRNLVELEAIALELDPQVERAIAHAASSLNAFALQTEKTVETAFTNADAAPAMLPELDRLFKEAERAQELVTEMLSGEILAEQRAANRTERTAHLVIGATALVALVALVVLTVAFGRSIVRSVGRLARVARAVVAGDLNARAGIVGNDEIAALGATFDEMADSLTAMLAQGDRQARRERFRSAIARALELADEEEDVYRLVERATAEIDPEAPMELLLADSSRAHLRRVAVSSAGGPAGCPVESPFQCAAVRRGHAVVFPSSERLDACPRLRDRPSGPISATCVPITFMGRGLGVLHLTGEVEHTLPDEQYDNLRALASQVGARIGTLRAFKRTQLQASTDSLTGLINRRTLEERVRLLEANGVPYGVVLADLDHFKSLNDTYGHQAGDRALQLFATALRAAVRESDLVARLGGEEFAVVLPKLSIDEAAEAAERMRVALASAVADSGGPRFTASFGVSASVYGEGLETVLRAADAALYRAKELGRNRVERADGAEASPRAALRVIERPEAEPKPALGPVTLAEAFGSEEEPRPSGVEIR